MALPNRTIRRTTSGDGMFPHQPLLKPISSRRTIYLYLLTEQHSCCSLLFVFIHFLSFFGVYCTKIQPQNATLAEYGTYSVLKNLSGIVEQIQAEVYARGPVATGVNAEPLVDYTGGRVNDTKVWHMLVNHIVSIIGWETDPATGLIYWIVRNSWGTLFIPIYIQKHTKPNRRNRIVTCCSVSSILLLCANDYVPCVF